MKPIPLSPSVSDKLQSLARLSEPAGKTEDVPPLLTTPENIAALRISEIRYRRLFEAARDGVLIMSPETRRITEANPFMTELLGFRRDELVGKELFEIGLFPDQHKAQEVFDRLLQDHHVRYDNLPLKSKDGATREVEVVANLYDENGQDVIQCNVRDISERRRMEEALRGSEARLQAIVAQANAGIAEMDLTGKLTLVNNRFCALVDRNAAELLGLHIGEVTHPEDRSTCISALAQDAVKTTNEKRYLRSDGTSIWVSTSLAPIHDRDRVHQGFVEISQDISERKRLEGALQTSETYFRELTQNIPIGVWTSLPDGRVDFINRHWLDYTGLSLDHAKSHPEAWVDSIHPEDRVRVAQISAAGRAAGAEYTLEARFRQASSGDYRWFLKRSLPVLDADMRLQKRVGVCIDIEDLKRSQTILMNRAGELSNEVNARTAELQETIGELEAFSYSISHDMRAPLRSMQGFAQLLLETHKDTLDAVSLDHLRRISGAATRMATLIRDLLSYSRLRRSEIVMQPIDLDSLIREMVGTFSHLQENGANVRIEGVLPTVLANESGLTQCISNLLSNAVKFVAPGVTARIRIHADEIEGDCRLWIEDNGIGIDPENHVRIWNIFAQVGGPKDYEGTGIGLAIVRKSMARMGGTVGFESALGAGTKFWLRLRKA